MLNRVILRPICLGSMAFLFLLIYSSQDLASAVGIPDLVSLVMPEVDSLAVAKRPLIQCAVRAPFFSEDMLVLLDGVDVSGIVETTSDGFEFRPVGILAPGPHMLSVKIRTTDGIEVQEDFMFSTRHSGMFEEAVSNNEITTVYDQVLKSPDDMDSIADSRIEANLWSKSRLKEKKWEFTFDTQFRFLDQNIPVYSPEEKGVSLVNYLLQGKYTGDKFQLHTELGDVQVDETQNTVQYLARRGGKLSLRYKDLNLKGFVTKSDQVFGFEGGTGLSSDTGNHIMGLSGDMALLSNRMNLKAIYVSGGEEAESYMGTWSEDAKKKGDTLGLVFKTDFFQQKLTTEAELDFSEYDPDTSDEFSSESDKAYRVRAGGYAGHYSYEAIYEYMGPDYEVIGNQGLQKDREGFNIRAGADFSMHSANISFSGYNDNVKKDALYPRIYTYQGGIDYTLNKFQCLPIGLSYQKSMLESDMEPEYTPPLEMDTDTMSGRINYMRGPWNLGLQASHSIQDDRTPQGNDTTTTTYTFSPAYSSRHIAISPSASFNRSKYKFTGTRTDTSTINLDLRGDIFDERVTYEFGGTYNRTRSNDGTVNQHNLNTSFRVAYVTGKRLWGFLLPSVGIRGQYGTTRDKAYDDENEDFLLMLAVSSSMLFSF